MSVKVEALHKTFRVGFRRRKVAALRGVSFEVKQNEIVGLIGPNGAGKTTSLKVLTGLVRPDSGTAVIFGKPASDVTSRARMGYLPESPYFYEHLRAPELLRFYGQLFGLGRKVLNDRIEQLLVQVGLADATDRPIRKFSKGMRQRVGIAQALINDPELVILDEPQSGLDPTGRKEVRDLIATLRDNGKTVLFSSHILPDVEAICDRVIVMSSGVVVEEGALADLTSENVSGWELIARGGANVADGIESVHASEPRGDLLLLRLDPDADLSAVINKLVDNGGELVSVTPERASLEAVYLRDT